MTQGSLTTELMQGFEGYAHSPKGRGYQFYGYVNPLKCFSWVYRIKDLASEKEMSFSYHIRKEDAIHLENAMLIEKQTRRPVSETIQSGLVFIICFVGDWSLISFAKYGFSCRMKDDDYEKLLQMVIAFLDKPSVLDEQQTKLRRELKKKREDFLQSHHKHRRSL